MASTETNIARSAIGVIVRVGAPKPDITSADAFKRAMLNATPISYAEDGVTATHLANLFQRLGIAEQMKSKTKLVASSARSVAVGESQLGFMTISVIQLVSGVELLGPLPPELQGYLSFTAGVGSAAMEGAAGKAFIRFLKAPAAVPVLKAKGMEPITP